MPALALIRRLLQDRVTATGARVASELLALGDIEQEFSRFRISVRRDVRWPQADSLFEKVLGPEIEILPSLVRRVHTQAPLHLSGRASIEGSQHWAGRWIARLFGFPASAPDIGASVVLKRHGSKEVWIRRFERSAFRSTLRAASAPKRVYEWFGPFDFELEITPDSCGFALTVVSWKIGFVRLPLRLAPRAPAKAFMDEDGRYRFDVAIALPWIGQLMRYRGWLLPAA